jgi:ATP:ADP antiporter, AAA family
MVLRPARDALGMQRGIEAVRWLFMGTLSDAARQPVFGLLVSRFRRSSFIALTHAFFALNLLGFYLLLLVLTPEAVGDHERPGVLRLDERVQPVHHDGVLGADGGPLLARAEQAHLRRDRRRRHGRRHLRLGVARAPRRAPSARRAAAHRRRVPLAATSPPGASRGCSPTAAGRSPTAVRECPPHRASPEDRAVIGGSAWEGFRAVFRSPYLLGISAYVLILAVMVTFVYFTRLQMVAALGDEAWTCAPASSRAST